MEDKLRRGITIAALCLGIAAPTALAAPGDHGQGSGGDHANGGRSDLAKECTALQKADRAAFKATYGPKHAMRHCLKGEDPAADETTPAEFKNAAEACREERAADRDAFLATYGSNKNHKNAMGKCVSSQVKHQDDDEGGEATV